MQAKNRPITKTDYYFVGSVALISVAINAVVTYGMMNFTREIEALGGRVVALEAKPDRGVAFADGAVTAPRIVRKGSRVR